MTQDLAEELMARMDAELEKADLTHFVVRARALSSLEGHEDYQVVVGTICRDFLAVAEPGDWNRDKWMLGVRGD